MQHFPVGTVTFLLSDIEGSTRLWEEARSVMQASLVRHDELMQQCIERHEGVVVKSKGEGDSLFAVFTRPSDAVAAAYAAQQALAAEPWPTPRPIRVRMAIHTGEAQLRDGDYYGPTVNRCARIRATGYGGQVLLSGVTARLVEQALPDGVTVRSLGQHRLKDLAAPEEVYQLAAADLAGEFPSLKSLNSLPHNLPIQATPLVGREAELDEVRRLLQSSRLLTLTGPGGTGKTRMALQLAAELVDQFPDGVWLVELDSLADPGVVPHSVAAVLGVREEPGRPLTAALAEHLRSKSLLLILDNCEHLLDACATMISNKMRTCPDVRILATSRTVLGIPGETVYHVPPLTLPDVRRLPPVDRMTMYEAVRLFVDRATAANAGFAVTAENAPAIAEICHRLDGIPLAIELAAARVKVLSPDQIAARLTDRFRLLTGGSRVALPRQQTLRALVDWSHDHLPDSEQIMWRRLTGFAGGFTLEAAEAVAAFDPIEDWEVLDLISQLVDKSLVQAALQGEVNRYRLLETLRQYGAEKLAASGERDEVSRRHRDYCLAQAKKAAPQLRGPQGAVWVARLEQEHDNLRAALEYSKGQPDPGHAFELGTALGLFWYYLRYYAREGLDQLEELLELASGDEHRVKRADLHSAAGRLANLQSDYTAGRRHFEAALDIYRELGMLREMGGRLNNLALIAMESGEHEHALTYVLEARPITESVGDPNAHFLTLLNLFRAYIFTQDHQRAQQVLTEAHEIAGRVTDKSALANLYVHTAEFRLLYSETEQAIVSAERALAAARSTPDRAVMARAHLIRGICEHYAGRPEPALALVRQGFNILREGEMRRHWAYFIGATSQIYIALGRYEAGVKLMAAGTLRMNSLVQKIWSMYSSQYKLFIGKAKEVLGEEGYARALAEGAELSIEAATALAMED